MFVLLVPRVMCSRLCPRRLHRTRPNSPHMQTTRMGHGGFARLVGLLGAILLAGCAHQPSNTAPPANPSVAYIDLWGHDLEIQVGPDDGLWQRIRHSLGLTNACNPRIEEQVNWLRAHPRHLTVVSQRARPFLHYIVEETHRRGLPMELALLPMVESGFLSRTTSHQSAAGFWQIIPSTARHLGLTLNHWYDGRRDLRDSTRAALNYLEYLYDFFDGDWLLALAAYNAGEGTVRRAVRANVQTGRPTDYWSLDLPTETLYYVPKLLALSQVILNPDAYDIALETIDDAPFLAEVSIGPSIDLSIAAVMAGVPKDTLYALNTGLRPGLTRLRKPYGLLLPRDHALTLEQRLQVLPQQRPHSRWQIHRVNSGETLAAIAARYGTSSSLLRAANELPLNAAPLPPGTELLVQAKISQDTYVVRRGDTLTHIARRLGVPFRKLARWNGLSTKSLLHPGQKLLIRN